MTDLNSLQTHDLERKTLLVNAKNCTFKKIAGQLYGIAPRSETEAWNMFYEILLKSRHPSFPGLHFFMHGSCRLSDFNVG